MTSAMDRPSNIFILFALLLCVLAAPGCESEANPVLPSTGIPNPTGLVTAGSIDGGSPIDTLPMADAQDASVGDLFLDVMSGTCDLLTQLGCQPDQACYPGTGIGQCQDSGFLSENTPCFPSEGREGQCGAGLACVPTRTLGDLCEPLCDTRYPPKGCACTLLGGGFATVGYCLPD